MHVQLITIEHQNERTFSSVNVNGSGGHYRMYSKSDMERRALEGLN